MRVNKSTAPIGAEIFDIDLSKGLDDAAFQEASEALHEHEVIVFRAQQLGADQQMPS